MKTYDFTTQGLSSAESLQYTINARGPGEYKVLHGKKENIPGPKYLLIVPSNTPAQEIDALILETLELFQEAEVA